MHDFCYIGMIQIRYHYYFWILFKSDFYISSLETGQVLHKNPNNLILRQPDTISYHYQNINSCDIFMF